jgi:hypothetical protein
MPIDKDSEKLFNAVTEKLADMPFDPELVEKQQIQIRTLKESISELEKANDRLRKRSLRAETDCGSADNELDTANQLISGAREAILKLIGVTDEYANEYINHKRAVDWGKVNDAFLSAYDWLKKTDPKKKEKDSEACQKEK